MASLPSIDSMRRSWLYLAIRSERDIEPVLICPALTATAFLQMVSALFGVSEQTSSSKPRLWRAIEKKLRSNNHGSRSVLIIDEGNSARQVVDIEDAPIRAVVVGIVDAVR